MSTKIEKCESSDARALYYVGTRKAELRRVHVPFVTNGGNNEHVLVRTLWSGISRGTERLVFEGEVPESEWSRMRAPHQEGEFPFPVKYGYAAVGIVEGGPAELRGKGVFALHPHQDRFTLPTAAVTLLPESLPPRRAILAANMETALNALWDSGASPGDRIVIVGAGALGLLIANLAGRLPATEVIVADIEPSRERVVKAFNASFALADKLGEAGADVVFHTSATSPGLAASLAAAGFEARIVEASWYGATVACAPLGGAFHSNRLKLISSQVGAISEQKRSRWTHPRRLAAALSLLADERLDALITDEVDFENLPETMPAIFAKGGSSITTAVRYGSIG